MYLTTTRSEQYQGLVHHSGTGSEPAIKAVDPCMVPHSGSDQYSCLVPHSVTGSKQYHDMVPNSGKGSEEYHGPA